MMKKLEIKEQEDSIRLRIKEDKEVIAVRYLSKEMYALLIQKAKKEIEDLKGDDEEVNKDLFKTLTVGKKTATDIQFLHKLRKFIKIYTGNVNVLMRLFAIKEEISKLKKKKIWKDTYYEL